MEAYEQKTKDIIDSFLSHRISLPQCTVALDAALAALIPTLSAEQLPRLRAVLVANNETVMQEMKRREKSDATE
jgi:hypothetical protein